MSYEPPSPENSLVLRQLAGVRRDIAESNERNARVIELLGRLNLRLDEMASRIDRGFSEIRSDIVMRENRTLTAVTEVRNLVARLDEEADARASATSDDGPS